VDDGPCRVADWFIRNSFAAKHGPCVAVTESDAFMLLSGLSTSIGAIIAINLSPDEATLAFLLGSAVGVMSTVSIAELWVHKAMEHSNWLGITAAVAAGGVVFAILDPLLPKPVEPQHVLQEKDYQQVRVWTKAQASRQRFSG